MTNEEKAREIANLCEACIENGHPCYGCSECESRGMYYGVLEMAEWKDKQFKDAINSTLDYFDRGRETGFVSENSYNDMRYFASKVINELFGE